MCMQSGSLFSRCVDAIGKQGFVLACTQAEAELGYVLVCTQAGARFCADVHAIGKLGFVLLVYTQTGRWLLCWYAR